MSIYYATNSPEYAILAGIALQTPAWVHHNLWELWGGAVTRGGDVTIPGAQGARGTPRIIDKRPVTLELTIVGDVDWQGLPQHDVRLGLWRNVEHLHGVVTAPRAADGSVLLTVVTPVHEIGARVIVEKLLLGGALGPGAVKATIDLVVLAGVFAEGIS